MAFLTLRARRFVAHAATLPENAALRSDWFMWERDHPPGPDPIELTPSAARMISQMLQRLEQHILALVEASGLDEDNLADAENDLSFVAAVGRDLGRGPLGQIGA